MQVNTSDFVHLFRTAAPYIHAHRGKTFVIKLPGEIMQTPRSSHLVYDVALLNSLGVRVVIVYGARPQIEIRLKSAGIETAFNDDLRVTDQTAMEGVKEAVGALGLEIKAKLSMSLGNTPMADACVQVATGNYVMAQPLGIRAGVDYQYTGKIRSINTDAINKGLDNNEIVLVPPIGYSSTGEVFNLGSDEVAAGLAIALKADKLIYITDKQNLIATGENLTHQLTESEAERILNSNEVEENQQGHLKRAVRACRQGVKRVHLIDRDIDGSLLQELFSRDGIGTMVSLKPFDDIRVANIGDIPGIFELIEPLEEEGVLVKRSREKLELEIDHFTVLLRDNVIIGCVALYPFNDDAAGELACLVIHQDYRNGGRAEELLKYVENIARENRLSRLFVMTTQTTHWFLEHGFSETKVEDLPVAKKELYNYQRNSRVLVKQLT